MGVYRRPDSVFWWMHLEKHRHRESTMIPVDGGSPEQSKELRRQAQVLYAKRMADLAAKRHGVAELRERRTFAQQRAWYEAHVSAQKRASEKEHWMLARVGAFFDRDELDAIDHDRVREWRTARLKSVSPSSVRREEALLRHVLSTAVPKYLEHHPLEGLRSVRVAATDTRVLTPDEETRLLKAAPDAEARALLVLAIDTLLRLGDARRLRRGQDHGRHLFSDTKVDAIQVPISARLRRALDAVPRTSVQYFPTYAHRTDHEARKMFLEACRRARIPLGRAAGGVSFHCLRHTGASRMLEAGIDVKTVMEIGGWKNLKVLERYLHPSDERKHEAVNRIGRHVSFTSRGRSGKFSKKTASR